MILFLASLKKLYSFFVCYRQFSMKWSAKNIIEKIVYAWIGVTDRWPSTRSTAKALNKGKRVGKTYTTCPNHEWAQFFELLQI
jgi:hypothetical protein